MGKTTFHCGRIYCMLGYFSKYWFDFIYVMTVKEVKARYKKAVFGFLWAIINPILQMLTIGIIFQYLIPNIIENYFIFLFSGLLAWNFFSLTITKCTEIILNERALIKKANFPRESLVISIALSNMLHLIISLILFFLVTAIFGYVSISSFITMFFSLVWLFLFTVGFSLLLATLYVKYRDIKFIVQAAVPLLFYATPILYKRDLLPAIAGNFIVINPMTVIVELFQFSFQMGKFPNMNELLVALMISILISVIGLFYFIKESQTFDDWI